MVEKATKRYEMLVAKNIDEILPEKLELFDERTYQLSENGSKLSWWSVDDVVKSIGKGILKPNYCEPQKNNILVKQSGELF